MIVVRPAFLDPSAVAALATAADQYDPATGRFVGREGRTANNYVVEASHLLRDGNTAALGILAAFRELVKAAVAADARRPLETDLTALAVLTAGGSHYRHADNRKPDGRGGWEPNHTPHRVWSTVLYLGTAETDWEGGPLVFPTEGVTIRPTAGMLVTFDSRLEHEVPPVTAGRRATVPIWLTDRPERFERFPAVPIAQTHA